MRIASVHSLSELPESDLAERHGENFDKNCAERHYYKRIEHSVLYAVFDTGFVCHSVSVGYDGSYCVTHTESGKQEELLYLVVKSVGGDSVHAYRA